MKKLILSAAILLGVMSVQAFNTVKTVSVMESVTIQDEFTEISADAIPAEVKSTLEKSFPNTKLEKAYKNEKNEYKLDILNGDKKFTIYTDATGNVIKK